MIKFDNDHLSLRRELSPQPMDVHARAAVIAAETRGGSGVVSVYNQMELSVEEIHEALAYLCGYAPSAVQIVLARIQLTREVPCVCQHGFGVHQVGTTQCKTADCNCPVFRDGR